MAEISAREGNVVSIGTVRRQRASTASAVKMTAAQRAWLGRGMTQAGGKLPLFDNSGQRISERTVRSCIRHGWDEPWFDNPLKPDWMVCKITAAGRRALADSA